MDVEKAIMERYSVRSFQEKEIPKEIIDKIKKAIWISPSADNRQPYRFVFVKDKTTKNRLVQEGKTYRFVKDAPLVLVAVANPDEAYPYIGNEREPVYLLDIGIALSQANLIATENGIGGCWVIVFDEEKIKEILNIPKNYKVIALFPMGYPKDRRGSIHRKRENEPFFEEKM